MSPPYYWDTGERRPKTGEKESTGSGFQSPVAYFRFDIAAWMVFSLYMKLPVDVLGDDVPVEQVDDAVPVFGVGR